MKRISERMIAKIREAARQHETTVARYNAIEGEKNKLQIESFERLCRDNEARLEFLSALEGAETQTETNEYGRETVYLLVTDGVYEQFEEIV